MERKAKWLASGFTSVLAVLLVAQLVNAQFEGLEGMEAPDDVSGVECSMCHGEFATMFEFSHEPAYDGDCVSCHLETGEGGHGGLVTDGRGLCLECHREQAGHYDVVDCWSAGCHTDVHGSNVEEHFIASRGEPYPGFFESTAGADYVGSHLCVRCHPEKHEWWGETVHSVSDADDSTPCDRRGCESCHGPGGKHFGRIAGIGIFEYTDAEEADAVCLACHKDETFVPEYQRTIHAKTGVVCTSCHNPHSVAEKHNLVFAPNEVCFACHETKRLDFARFSHHPVDLADPRSGMQCTACHNPHGGIGASMLKVERGDLCADCHLDKRGPFVYWMSGYDPNLGRGCLTCHAHHGANNANLLNLRGRPICLQCHTDQITHGGPQLCWTSGCHTEHHGSNTSFFFFGQ